MDEQRIVVITGLSGAGRTATANVLEDLGYFCIDNMPVALLPAFAELRRGTGPTLGRVALVIDIREREFFEGVTLHLQALTTTGIEYEMVFLEAVTDILVQRYSESRRRHPMADTSDDLRGAIGAEREQLAGLRRQAAVVIDTSQLTVHQLRDRIRDRYGSASAAVGMQAQVVSFGFKYGVPAEVDLVFDVRFLPNPHYDPLLRPLTGEDEAVREHVLGADSAAEFLDRTTGWLEFALPAYAREGKSYLTIGIGCTGGRHRSVVLAVALAERLGRTDAAGRVQVRHRDLLRVDPS